MEALCRLALVVGVLLISMVQGLAERHLLADVLSDDSTSFLMTRGRQSESRRKHFDDFREKYSRPYQHGSPEYSSRRALFEGRVSEIEKHNADPRRSWKAAVNHLTDRTEEELKQLRGYRRDARPENSGAGLFSTSAVTFDLSQLPSDFSWRGVLRATTEVQDQAQCGSCWAFSSATVLRAHSELFQKDHHFSAQQIVSCTPNPQECGGKGGCTGATAELAMDYVSKVGCLEEKDFPYQASELKCPAALQVGAPLDVSTIAGPSLHQMAALGANAASLGMTGFNKLPENQLEPLLFSLYSMGPLAVSIAAGNGWNMYESGIYDTCQKDAVIDHAVMLVGWGEEKALNMKYWQIQNSWGRTWGEGGFIRIVRHDHQTERGHCGWDKDPGIGSGCKGGPSSVWICGSCGILYDVVMPTFDVAPGSWWAQRGRNATVHSNA